MSGVSEIDNEKVRSGLIDCGKHQTGIEVRGGSCVIKPEQWYTIKNNEIS